MRKKRLFILTFLLLVVAGTGFFLFNYFQKKQASLEVNSNIKEDVLVDGISIGSTPLSYKSEPKEVTIQIANYQTKVNLVAGIKTIVERDFNTDASESWGSVLSFENTGLTNGTLAVVSEPAGALVKVDSHEYGVTPISIQDLTMGNHKMNASMDGYESKDFDINIYNGYKLTAYIDLLATASRSENTIQIQKDTQDIFVKILSTPNGFLRVRMDPTTASNEVARVHEGEEYLLKSTDKKTGWYDIELNASASGWISDIYAATESAKAH